MRIFIFLTIYFLCIPFVAILFLPLDTLEDKLKGIFKYM